VSIITDFCICIYVLGCYLSLITICDSIFGITTVDDITIGITCAAFCFHTAHIAFASYWYLFCLSVIVWRDYVYLGQLCLSKGVLLLLLLLLLLLFSQKVFDRRLNMGCLFLYFVDVRPNIMIVFFTNLIHKFFILIHLLYSSTCFEQYYAHLQEDSCISTASCIVTLQYTGYERHLLTCVLYSHLKTVTIPDAVLIQFVASFSLQHGHRSNPAAPNLQHTENREQNIRCSNSTAKSQASDDGYIGCPKHVEHVRSDKIASGIKLVFYSSTTTMMHGPINIRKTVFNL